MGIKQWRTSAGGGGLWWVGLVLIWFSRSIITANLFSYSITSSSELLNSCFCSSWSFCITLRSSSSSFSFSVSRLVFPVEAPSCAVRPSARSCTLGPMASPAWASARSSLVCIWTASSCAWLTRTAATFSLSLSSSWATLVYRASASVCTCSTFNLH